MLVTHPYVKDVHFEENRLPDGSLDRVLVVESTPQKKSFFNRHNNNDNDNKMDELVRQLQSLDTLAKHGFTDFKRVEIRQS